MQKYLPVFLNLVLDEACLEKKNIQRLCIEHKIV